jgi:uncharacterized protein YlaI
MVTKICRNCHRILELKTCYHNGGHPIQMYECPQCGDLLDREKVDDGLLWNRGVLRVMKE